MSNISQTVDNVQHSVGTVNHPLPHMFKELHCEML